MLPVATLNSMFPTGDFKYMFSVQVSKGSKAPVSFTIPVSLTEAAIPGVSIAAGSGVRQSTGVISVNPNDQVIVFGECKKTRQTMEKCNFT